MTTATLTATISYAPKTTVRKPRYLVTKSTWSLSADEPCLASTVAMTLAETIALIEFDMNYEGGKIIDGQRVGGTLVSDIKSERDENGVWAYREHVKINRIDGGMVSGREMSRLMVMAGM